MKRTLTVLMILSLVALFAYACDGGTGSVCTQATTVSNTAGAMLYYPCNISSPRPATTMMSGYMGTYSEVAWLSRDVAANGFVVLAMTPTNLLGMVSGWRAAHQSGIAKLQSLNNSGILQGKIDTSRLQTCGHSKGGGGSLWASSNLGSTLTSTIGMAPWQEEFLTLSGIRSATLIQAGLLDTLATSLMTLNEYNLLPTGISKAYFMYTAADHMSWSSIGLIHGTLSDDVVAWMKYYLNGDTSQRATLNSWVGKTTNTWVDRGTNGGSSSSGGCN